MVKKAKKTSEFDLNMLQVFKKVEVTIPLIDAIQQIPKGLCKHHAAFYLYAVELSSIKEVGSEICLGQ
ncbi:hypothetical protein AHAS_Ahas15G0234200 [Arachis hypogaea]